MRYIKKFEAKEVIDLTIPKDLQLNIMDIMTDVKDDLGCRVSYQWWPPYYKYDPQYRAGDKYAYITISDVLYSSLKGYISRLESYLAVEEYSICVRYDSIPLTNPVVKIIGLPPRKRRVFSNWKILRKGVDFKTDFRIELINNNHTY